VQHEKMLPNGHRWGFTFFSESQWFSRGTETLWSLLQNCVSIIPPFLNCYFSQIKSLYVQILVSREDPFVKGNALSVMCFHVLGKCGLVYYQIRWRSDKSKSANEFYIGRIKKKIYSGRAILIDFCIELQTADIIVLFKIISSGRRRRIPQHRSYREESGFFAMTSLTIGDDQISPRKLNDKW